MRTDTMLLLVLSTLASHAAAGGLVLDDFDSDPNDDLFGARTFSYGITADPYSQGGATIIDTMFDSGDDIGAMIMNSGIGAQQYASLRYLHNTGSIDLSGNGVLAFDFLAVDLDFSIRVVMIGGDGGKAVIDQLHVGAGGPQTVEYDIMNDSDFTNIDLSEVVDIRIEFNDSFRVGDDFERVASLDFVLSEIRAVPAPASLAMLGFGGLALGRRRR